MTDFACGGGSDFVSTFNDEGGGSSLDTSIDTGNFPPVIAFCFIVLIISKVLAMTLNCSRLMLLSSLYLDSLVILTIMFKV